MLYFRCIFLCFRVCMPCWALWILVECGSRFVVWFPLSRISLFRGLYFAACYFCWPKSFNLGRQCGWRKFVCANVSWFCCRELLDFCPWLLYGPVQLLFVAWPTYGVSDCRMGLAICVGHLGICSVIPPGVVLERHSIWGKFLCEAAQPLAHTNLCGSHTVKLLCVYLLGFAVVYGLGWVFMRYSLFWFTLGVLRTYFGSFGWL